MECPIKIVSRRSWESREVPQHLVSFDKDGGEFVGDGDQTHQGQQLIERKQAGRLHLHEDLGKFHSDVGLSGREMQNGVLIKLSRANSMPGCDIGSSGRRMRNGK